MREGLRIRAAHKGGRVRWWHPPMLGNPLVSSSRTRQKFLRSVGFSIAYHIVPQKVSALRAGPVQMSNNLCCAAIFSKLLEKNQVLSKFAEKSRVFSKIFGKKPNFVKIWGKKPIFFQNFQEKMKFCQNLPKKVEFFPKISEKTKFCQNFLKKTEFF